MQRREFMAMAGAAAAFWPLRAHAADDPSPPATSAPKKSRLILLGTAGGPTPKPNRAAPAQVVVVDNKSYVIDCGNGVARQMVLAKLKLASIRSVVSSPEFAEKVKTLGVFPKPTSPQELDALIGKEIERWTAIAKAASITVD